MTIQIEIKTVNKDCFEVYIDEDLVKKAHKKIFGNLSFGRNDFSNLDELEQFLIEKEKNGARSYLARCLGRKNLHSLEADKILSSLFVSFKTIQEVLMDFKDKGYLDDARYVTQFINHYSSRGKGSRWIHQKLKQIGLGENEIRMNLHQMDAHSTQESLSALITKKSARQNIEDPKFKRRLIGFLMRRGFSYEDISKALSIDEIS